jgi:hypothetical protein
LGNAFIVRPADLLQIVSREWDANVRESLTSQQNVVRRYPDDVVRIIVRPEEITKTRDRLLKIWSRIGRHMLSHMHHH